jgi:N-formylglutamate amidohydrolase
MIDVNRAENDIDPVAIDGVWPGPLAPDAATVAGFGLVRRLCSSGLDLYRAPLTVAEIERRLDIYYRPYHACVHSHVMARLAQFGSCILINAHSMPDRGVNGMPRPDFILGDRDGTSCAPEVIDRAKKILQSMGYRVVLNNPYKGREIVERYGMRGTGQGAQALQMEMNRKLYMDETTLEKNSDFDSLRKDLMAFFQIFASGFQCDTVESLAAE